MKNKPILRWFTISIVHLIMYVLGIVLFPLYFAFRKKRVFWWFLNDNEANYGDLQYRINRGFNYYDTNVFRKLYEAFIWLAIRNSHWSFRIHVMKPKQGDKYDINIITNNTTPTTSGLTFCNYTIHGKQYAKYTVKGYRYFRYSFSKPFVFGRMWNLHSGWAEGRWILKLRIFKK